MENARGEAISQPSSAKYQHEKPLDRDLWAETTTANYLGVIYLGLKAACMVDTDVEIWRL